MSHIRTSLPIPTQPWETARAKFVDGLSSEERQRFDNATIENFFYGAEVAQRTHAQESRIWPLQQRLSSLVDGLNDYGKVLDVYANTYGLILSPIWGSIRVVLHIAGEAGKFQDKLVDMFAQIGDVLPRFHIYESIYRNHERLLVALSEVYLDILHFCVRTKDFFRSVRRSMIPLSIVLRGAWKPFRNDFEEHMVAFRKHSKRIEKEARAAHRIEAAHMYEIQLANRALQLHNEKIKKRHQLLSMLPTVDYHAKHYKHLRLRHPGTNNWVKSSPAYSAWVSSQSSDCLCCFGIPGSGKSVLAASIVESLLPSQSGASSIVCYYYCDYAETASLDPYCLVASILKQVLQRVPLETFTDSFQSPFHEGKTLPSFDVMVRFLATILQDFSPAYIILDGIDEMARDDQATCLAFIDGAISQHPKLKVLLTSRVEEHAIRKAAVSRRTLHLSHAENADDIALYVQHQLDAAGRSNSTFENARLKQEVLDALLKGAGGMFLWVKFQLLELGEALTEHEVRCILRNLPRDLSETYTRIVQRIHQSPGGTTKVETMRKVFQWMAGARRLLSLSELEEAVAIEPSDKHLPTDRIARCGGDRLVSNCGNLVVYDLADDTVGFAHHTVQQYLIKGPTQSSACLQLLFTTSFDASSIDTYLTQVCLAYLSLADFETQLSRVPEQVVFERETAEGLVWWGVPLASQLRKALMWAQPSRRASLNATRRMVPLHLIP